MIIRFMAAQAIALALLTAPAFAGNESNFTYLALGDSIAFGYDPTVTAPTPDKFTGYPEIVAQVEHLLKSKKEVNASCPGQTSGSFLNPSLPDIGCQGFKNAIGLHTNYTGSQMNFAVSQILSNKHINLVTLDIGGNDLLLLEAQCAPAPSFAGCVGNLLPGVLGAYAQNLAQILTGLRTQADFDGTIVLVKSYSPTADPLFIQTVGALNAVMVQVGSQFGAKFADPFTAFQFASAFFQGDPCKAGLLIRLSSTTCDVHPSPLGRDLLAGTVLLALGDQGSMGNHQSDTEQK